MVRHFAQKRAGTSIDEITDTVRGWWESANEKYFRGELSAPHVALGMTKARELGVYTPATALGKDSQIIINEGVVVGSHRSVIHYWPAGGNQRFVCDILIHQMIHQWQFEVVNEAERGYRGHGSVFCDKANDIGAKLGLPEVIVRNRKGKQRMATCVHWPFNVRGCGYYLGDVAVHAWMTAHAVSHVPVWLSLFEDFVGLIEGGQVVQLRDILQSEIRRSNGRKYERSREVLHRIRTIAAELLSSDLMTQESVHKARSGYKARNGLKLDC